MHAHFIVPYCRVSHYSVLRLKDLTQGPSANRQAIRLTFKLTLKIVCSTQS